MNLVRAQHIARERNLQTIERTSDGCEITR